jgi:archaellum component FlaC
MPWGIRNAGKTKEKIGKKRKTRTKDENKMTDQTKKRGEKNLQNKEIEPIWQFWLGFEEKLPPRGSEIPQGI